ncbi:MAG TPA: TatD family hydrolase [Kiritimatiellia bacterium]|nr:TatD family hydrolase [Kiritimatiellia bacterium]
MNIALPEVIPQNPLAGAEWIDSHVHFDVYDRAGMMDLIVDRARLAGVTRMVAIGGSDEANERAVRLARRFPETLRATAGFDRDLAGKQSDQSAFHELLAKNHDVITAIGESGLDYHYEPDTAIAQKELFESMLEAAASVKLPVVVHSRDADHDTLDMLKAHARNWPSDPGRLGVLHCFTGTYEFARKLLDVGMMISFSGIITFRNADDLRDCARRLPLDRLLIETDAPYLAPTPHRGKTNEPAWVFRVAETLASIRTVALQDIAMQTTQNARTLFQLQKEATL